MINTANKFINSFSVQKAALIVGFFTLIAKFAAFYRERLLSTTFGQGHALDSYFSAFRIPDFITNLFVLSTLSVAFLPIFSELITRDKEKAKVFANTVLNWVIILLLALCALLYIWTPELTTWLVSGFPADYMATTVSLTRLFLISPIIFGISTLFGGILYANKRFVAASTAPLLYNLGIIAGILWLYPIYGIMGLGYGVILGAIFQMLLQIIAVFNTDYRWLPVLKTGDSSLKKMMRMYLPRILAFDLSNITLLLGTVVGSHFVAGSIAALNQAYNLQSVPIGIFAYSLAVAIFPVLSEQFARGKTADYIFSLAKTIRQLVFFMLPATILVLLYRAYIVRLLLGAGKFDWEDTIRTFTILGIFSFSLLSQSLTTLLARAFFARHNTRTPVLVNLCAIAINAILGIILSSLLGLDQGIYGLAIAFTAASLFNALALFILLRRQLKLETGDVWQSTGFDASIALNIFKTTFSSIVMGAVAFFALRVLAPMVNTHTAPGILFQAAVSGALSVAAFIGMAIWLKQEEIKSFVLLTRRVFKKYD